MGTKKFSAIRRPVTPERRDRIDAIKRAMGEAERLADLRASRGLTQVAMAAALGKSQGNVSEIEHREDLYLSTLREYVEALGGQLEISAVFRDERRPLAVGAEPNILEQGPAFEDVLGAPDAPNVLAERRRG